VLMLQRSTAALVIQEDLVLGKGRSKGGPLEPVVQVGIVSWGRPKCRGCTAYPSTRENFWIMNKQYLLFLLLLRILSLCQLPPNFWELHRPSPTSPSPILWLNNHCEINDADPNLFPAIHCNVIFNGSVARGQT
jgi:hypothetical protein